MRLWLSLAVVLFGLTGCQLVSKSEPIDGSSEASINGHEVRLPNQVQVQNLYDYPVKITWQDKEVILAPHSARYIIFEAQSKPGPIHVFKQDKEGTWTKKLTYVPKKSGKVYQVQ